jgi:hypothetical protein
VALLPASAQPPRLGGHVKFIRPDSGYEAAAEILSTPTRLLLVDLGKITPAHLGLLTLAARKRVPILAYGTVSAGMKGIDLSTIRLVAKDQIASAAAEMLSTEPAAAPSPTPARPADAPPQRAPAPVAPAAPVARASASTPAPSAPAPARLVPRPQSPAMPSGILTDAELKALLGDDL